MYELHCPNCGWSTVLGDDQIATALAEADRLQAAYHVEHCPRCQWVIRVAVDGLRAAAPASLLAAPVKPELLPEGKKPAVRKASVKKPAAKKPAAKKPAAKKPVAKKPVAKKTVAKKTTVKRKK